MTTSRTRVKQHKIIKNMSNKQNGHGHRVDGAWIGTDLMAKKIVFGAATLNRIPLRNVPLWQQ